MLEAKKTSVLRRFIMGGALAIGLFSVVLAWVLSQFVEQNMLTRDAEVSREFVQSMADSQNVLESFTSRDISRSPGFGEFVIDISAIPDVLRVNIYTPDRRVLWSSRKEMVGLSFNDNPELERSLHNQVVVEVTAGDDEVGKAEHMMLGNATSHYIEAYVPVVDTPHGAVIGVIELYRRPTELFKAIRQGQLLVSVSAVVGALFLFVCLIGFVRHTERALKEQQQRLVEADALALVGEISAAVAHSIRNPLGSIRSTAELQQDLDGDPHGAHGQIMGDVDRIESLVQTMLSYASVALSPETSPTPCDLNAVLESLRHRIEPELDRQQRRFKHDISTDLGQAAIDPVLLTQVLQSLITNACEATHNGGAIRLKAQRRSQATIISITDNGVGMDSAQLDVAFKPFNTTKPRGFGMGLALAHRVVERAGGQIHIASTRGRGTSVRLRLPLISPAAGA